MTWFRNTDTGNDFWMEGRHAEALRGSRNVVEIDAPGGDSTSEPAAPVSESDPQLAKLRRADLEALAKGQGLDSSGSKVELIARLTARSGGTVGAAVYSEPEINIPPPEAPEKAAPLSPEVAAAIEPAAEPGGTVGAAIYTEPRTAPAPAGEELPEGPADAPADKPTNKKK